MTFDPNGLPLPPVTVLVEVKSIRSWVYPAATELYQLLHKAVTLLTARPTASLVPVFVCRRAHPTTFWMAKQFGFIVIDMNRQFAGDVNEAELLEVRNELHFNNLYAGHGPSIRVRDRFTRAIPRNAAATAQQWLQSVFDPTIADLIGQLRYARTAERDALVIELRAANLALGRRGGW